MKRFAVLDVEGERLLWSREVRGGGGGGGGGEEEEGGAAAHICHIAGGGGSVAVFEKVGSFFKLQN